MSTIRIKKELQMLNSDPVEGCQVELVGDKLSQWKVIIDGPTNSPYNGGRFTMEITFPDGYPLKAPKAHMKTRIYHPNVDADGAMCLDVLREQWGPGVTMGRVLVMARTMMEMPNPDKPQDMEIAMQYKTNKAQYERTARDWTRRYAQ